METLLITCVIVSLVNLVLVFFSIKGGAMNDQKIGKLREDVRTSCRGKADLTQLRELENRLFVSDYYDGFDGVVINGAAFKITRSTLRDLFKYDAVMFEKLSSMLPIAFKESRTMYIQRCYTSKENAIKHKKEIEKFKKEVEKFRSLNAK